MPVKVSLPTAFTRHTDGKKNFSSAARDLPGLLSDIDQNYPALGTQIKDEQGKLRRFINIYINDEDIRFLGGDTYTFQDGDEVMLIPSIAGGADKAEQNTKKTGNSDARLGRFSCRCIAKPQASWPFSPMKTALPHSIRLTATGEPL